MKHRLTESTVNKSQILQWINTILNGNQTKIESLGNGIVYCMLINHHYPNSIPLNKIIMMPRNNMDNKANLKKVQEALQLLNIKSITFDIFRVSEMSYLDNWQLINKFHKHFNELQKNKDKQSNKYDRKCQTQQPTNVSQNQNINQHHVITQPQTVFTLPKQMPKVPDFSTGLLTPMKGLKYFEENTKMRYQSLRLMEQIKSIVKSESESDKIKVKILKKMLGLTDEDSQEEQWEMKDLFSDCKQKQQVITID